MWCQSSASSPRLLGFWSEISTSDGTLKLRHLGLYPLFPLLCVKVSRLLQWIKHYRCSTSKHTLCPPGAKASTSSGSGGSSGDGDSSSEVTGVTGCVSTGGGWGWRKAVCPESRAVEEQECHESAPGPGPRLCLDDVTGDKFSLFSHNYREEKRAATNCTAAAAAGVLFVQIIFCEMQTEHW